MHTRSRLPLLLAVATLACTASPPAPDPQPQAAPLVAGRRAVWLMMKDQADLSGATARRTWKERGQFVYDRLTAASARSRAALQASLAASGAKVSHFWIVNAVRVEADEATISALARDPAVAEVLPEQVFAVPPLVTAPPVAEVQGVEWGLASVRAPQVWSTSGVRGDGMVVASIDTGVQFDHPALVRQYRGNGGSGTFDHNYNWFDPTGLCPGGVPCDGNSHGTHTMGTMIGDDGDTNQIGVAPGARWIAARGCESTSCSQAALLSAGQWLLAPTDSAGNNPRPDLRPNVINNSWGGAGNNPFFRATVQAWVAAGIFPAFAAGNAGPACATASSPGDYPESYAAGAHGSDGTIASFSSRGASAFGGTKPNITAPGVSVRSSVPGNGYDVFSGTSMATPHLAGAVALLWSAVPSLAGDVAGTRAVLDLSAVDVADLTCGGTAASNNVWGEGRLDVLGAVLLSPGSTTGTLAGSISAAGGGPLAGASIQAEGPLPRTATSGADGSYSLLLPVGNYHLTVTLNGRTGQAADVVITENATTTQSFVLEPAPTQVVSGTVRDAAGAPQAGRLVKIAGVAPAVTDAAGQYSLSVPGGQYTVSIDPGRCLQGKSVSVTLDADKTVDFTLAALTDQFGYTCAPAPFAFVDATTLLSLTGDNASASLSLPFALPFYGTTYSSVRVSTNGFLAFGAGTIEAANTALPAAAAPNAAIYPFWDDLVIDALASVRTQTAGAAPSRKFIVEWRNALIKGTSLRVRFEVVLEERGHIEVHYHTAGTDDLQRGSSATLGIENASGTVALPYSFNEAAVASSTAVRYTAPDQPPTVSISFPTFGMYVGHTGSISVSASDDVGLASVEALVDGTVIGSKTAAPFNFPIDYGTYSEGPHQITARATDTAGHVATTAFPTPITVDNTKPKVKVLSPAKGSPVSGTITVTVDVVDTAIQMVDLWLDGGSRHIGTRTSPPWTFTLDTTTMTQGDHFLVASAYDWAMNFGDNILDWHNVIVDNTPDLQPPTVTLTAPVAGAAIGPFTKITGTTADDVKVVRVDFLLDGGLVSSYSTAAGPFSFDLGNGATAGPHQLTAKVFDGSGKTGLSAAIPVVVDLTPPSVAITEPATGSAVKGVIPVVGAVSDDTGISYLMLFVDGGLRGATATPPWSFSLDTAQIGGGAHTLQLKAIDSASNSAASAVVTINVDVLPPTVAITSPAGGGTVRGLVDVTASASDANGVAAVELAVDGTLRETVTAAPYLFHLDTTTLADGLHSVAATAVDRAGNRQTDAISLRFDNTPPAGAIVQPLAGAVVRGTVSVAVTASDEAGTVASVEFLVDGVARATASTAPFGWSWDTAADPEGAHTLTARLTDGLGNQSLTAPVAVTITRTNQYLWTEAEAGALTAPMQLGDDGAASGTKYVTVTPGQNSTGAPPATGRAIYTFTVNAADQYRFWARVSAPGPADDSFWVSVDGAPFFPWSDLADGSAWHWDAVRSGSQPDPVVVTLGAGAHTLELAYSEDGALLDRLLITNDPGFVPTGHEPAPPLPAVTGLAAAATAGKISLSWGAVTGATEYQLWRAVAANGLYPTLVATGAATGAADTQVVAGTTYCYIVNARNASGASAPSAEVCATAAPTFVTLSREAELGTISAPLQVQSDSKASAGKYVNVPRGRNSLNTPPDKGRASYVFSVPAAGTYKVWARVIAPDKDSDSFWVRMDGGPFVKWSNVTVGTSWHWDFARNGDQNNALVTFTLAPGNHTLQFAYREDDAKLDKVLITSDAALVPTGVGP